MRIRPHLLLGAVVLVLAACGGGSSSASDGGDFCARAEALAQGTGLEDLDPEDPAAIAEAVAIFDDLTAAAPAEIEDDMALLSEIIGVFAEIDEDDPEAAFAVIGTLFERADELEAASVRLETYVSDECGLDISTDDGADDALGDGDGIDLFGDGDGVDGYGDDAGLDALWDACEGGDLGSCDELYLTSPFGSAYEDFGNTCGRTASESFGGCAPLDLGEGDPDEVDDGDEAGDRDDEVDDGAGEAGSVDAPDTYGDDPVFDALWDGCVAGVLEACDDLFLTSPVGSEYERFGSTCGDRESAGTFGGCSDDGADGDVDRFGDDPVLDALWDGCEAGQLGDCDELYLTSPFGSEYERFGSTCGDREAEETFGGCVAGAAESAVSYGDDAALDALWDSCAAGALRDCDELYFVSASGSDYEAFASTCGETAVPSFGTCATSATEPGDALTYGDDPVLDGLWDACEGGDGRACDDLYFQSPIGSEYETFGSTCGGRFEADTVFCEDELGAG